MKRYIIWIVIVLTIPIASFAYEFGEVDIHGFISQGYLKSDDINFLADTEDGTFEFNEMGINFSTKVADSLHLGMQFFSRDLGPSYNDEVEIDWAYADYRWWDYLGLRAGKIKTPFGLYHETRDVDMLRTSIIMPSSVYDENFRDTIMAIVGVGVYGEILTSHIGNFSYQLLYGSNNVKSNGGTARSIGASNFDVHSVEIGDITASSLQWLDPTSHLRIGGTIELISEITLEGTTTDYFQQWYGPPAGLDAYFDAENIENWVLSIEFIWGNFLFIAEYKQTHVDINTSVVILPTTYSRSDNIDQEGYYGLLSFRFNDWLEAGTYYEELWYDMDDKDATEFEASWGYDYGAWRKDWVLSLRFDINMSWILKIESHRFDGTALVIDKMNPDGLQRHWNLYAIKLSYCF